MVQRELLVAAIDRAHLDALERLEPRSRSIAILHFVRPCVI